MKRNVALWPCRLLLAASCLALAACATTDSTPVETVAEVPAPSPTPVRQTAIEEVPLRAMLAFYATNARQPAEPVRERSTPTDPYLLMQQAIVLGQARNPDFHRASVLLEQVMKSSNPVAVNLAPLARLLHEQYGERQRLDLQLREAQRRADQLQEKIDALSAIERSLPVRALPKVAPRSTP